MNFLAEQISCYVEDDVRVVSFAVGKAVDPDTYIILSKTEFEEDDDNFGVYIESSFGITGYDLVRLKNFSNSTVAFEVRTAISHPYKDLIIHLPEDSPEILSSFLTKIFESK
ncbi:hypothetical protein [Hydromonas duriensis]|uniref:Uncharacterized protein n=1 Tax=Hydromonas duriensis TaxID=1527608 RepID=A0A4R6Y091_9BURK|nr:hypothetical protein [Hydromonas duriensis]TDR27847.1 hypothetical protein DFR44_13719 [Hydromonas duriensis]